MAFHIERVAIIIQQIVGLLLLGSCSAFMLQACSEYLFDIFIGPWNSRTTEYTSRFMDLCEYMGSDH
jgi:hypothetical protein